MTDDLDTNGNPIEPPSLTLEEELAFVDPTGWARGEVRRLAWSVFAIWEGEPDPAAILATTLLGPSTP